MNTTSMLTSVVNDDCASIYVTTASDRIPTHGTPLLLLTFTSTGGHR